MSEREIQRDGSDVTIVALKLAMSFTIHFPLPKIRTFRFFSFTLPISPFL